MRNKLNQPASSQEAIMREQSHPKGTEDLHHEEKKKKKKKRERKRTRKRKKNEKKKKPFYGLR